MSLKNSLSGWATLMIAWLCLAAPAVAQDRFKAGSTPLFDSTGIRELRTLLQAENWARVLEKYFGVLYDSSLPDLVIYVPKHGDAKHALMWRDESREWLPGKRQVWVLVFSEVPLRDPPGHTLRTHRSITNDSTKTVTDTIPVTIVATNDSVEVASISKDTITTISIDSTQTARETTKDSLGVRRSIVTTLETRVDTTTTTSSPVAAGSLVVSLTSLDYKKDRVLTALVKALSGGAATPTAAAGRDTTATVRLRLLGSTIECQDTIPLYVTTQRFNLAENTVNRVSIGTAATNASFPSARGIHVNFGNHSSSLFGAGLGGGFTFPSNKSEKFEADTLVEQGPWIEPALYLFGHVYFRKPRLPWNTWHLGVTVGTSLVKVGILDNIVVGGTIGRVNDLGLVLGGAWIEDKKFENGKVKKFRKLCVFVGVDFAL